MFTIARRFLLLVPAVLLCPELQANIGSLDTASEVAHEATVWGRPSADIHFALTLQTKQSNGGDPVYTVTVTMMNVSKVPQSIHVPNSWGINGKQVRGSEAARMLTLAPGEQKAATSFRWSGLARGKHAIHLGAYRSGYFNGQIIAEKENDTNPKVVFLPAFSGC